MPGMVKVGFTEKGEVQRRANELSSSSSVPLPFSIEHEVLVEDPRKFEALIHKKLKRFRVSPDREFFQIDVEEAIRDVDKIGRASCRESGALYVFDVHQNKKS